MADNRVPLSPCVLCDQVPGAPVMRPDGWWRVMCPLCGRMALSETEAEAREMWAKMNERPKAPLSPALELLDSIESAMCDLEAIRQVPGAMDAWHKWMDALKELRAAVEKAEREAGA